MATTQKNTRFTMQKAMLSAKLSESQEEDSTTIDELLALLDAKATIKKIVEDKMIPSKPRRVSSKHLKFCGKKHPWTSCPYNPQRGTPAIMCPVCREYTVTLRDYGRCKKCLFGNKRQEQRDQKEQKWQPQNGDSEEGENWNPNAGNGPTEFGCDRPRKSTNAASRDQPGLTCTFDGKKYTFTWLDLVVDITYCVKCGTRHYDDHGYQCDQCSGQLFLDKYSHKRNWLHCECASSYMLFKRESLPADAQPISEHGCKEAWLCQAPDLNEDVSDSIRNSWNPITRAKMAFKDSVRPVVDFARERVDTVVNGVDSVTTEFKTLGVKVNGIVDGLTQFIADLPEKMPGADTIMSLVAGVIGVFAVFKATDSFTARMASVGLFLSRYISVNEVLEWALTIIKKIMPMMKTLLDFLVGRVKSGWNAQGPADDILKVSSGIVAVLVGIFLKKIPAKQDFDSVLRRMDLFPKAIKGAGDMYNYVKALITAAFSSACEGLGIKNPLQSGLPEEVDVWVKEAHEILTMKMTEGTYTSAFADRVMNCYVQGTIVVKNLNMTRAEANIVRYVSTVQSSISSLNNKLAHLGFTSGPRAEPLMVYLHGTSGKGKSGLTVPFFIELAKHDKDLDASAWQKLIYMRCAENEFWDGARNDQPFLCYDDFAQQRDSAANPNAELFEIIRLANIVPYPAHMASLEEKGKTFLHPKCVLLTSNSRTPRIESLTYPQAFFRRMDIVAEVDVKDEYCMDKTLDNGQTIRTLDTSKCAAAFDPRIYIFRVDTGAGRDMDYMDFMQFVTNAYDSKMERGNRVLKELNNFTKHSTAQIYDAIANGTFGNMVAESAKGTPWSTQGGQELDPYVPANARPYEELVKEIAQNLEGWTVGEASPTEELLDVLKALHRQLTSLEGLNEHQDKQRDYWDEILYDAERDITAALPTFTDGIDSSTVMQNLYKLYLFEKLPAQKWPDKCKDEDRAILSYFNGQRNVMFNRLIWTDEMFKGEVWDSELKTFRKLTKKDFVINALTGIQTIASVYLSPATVAMAVYMQNANDKNGTKFDLHAVARAYKCMYYGKFMKDRQIDEEINDIVDLYVNRGARAFTDRLKTVNRKACVRISKLFVQTSDECSRIGCPDDLEVCYRMALHKAIRTGVVLKHEVDEMNQSPVYLDEITSEVMPEMHGDSIWTKIKEKFLKCHLDALKHIDNTFLKWAYVILVGGAISQLVRLTVVLSLQGLKMSYKYIRSFFEGKDKLTTEGRVLDEVKIASTWMFSTKIKREDCKLCQNGELFPEGIAQLKEYYLSRKGFVSRFDFWSIRRVAFQPQRFDLAAFKRYQKYFDSKVGPGFFHACIHGELDSTPIYDYRTFNDEEVRMYEKDYHERWSSHFGTESFNMKDARQQKLKVESFSTKEARQQKINVESFTTKDARTTKLNVESSPEKSLQKLEKMIVELDGEVETSLIEHLENKAEELRGIISKATYQSEGNPTVESYFEAMKNVYGDAKVMPEGMIDANAWDIISKKLWTNQAIMTTVDGNEICKGVFIRGNCFLTYKHWKSTCHSDMVEMRYLDNRPYFRFSLKETKTHEHRNRDGEVQDIVILELPKYCPAYPDITKFFVTKDQLTKVIGRTAQLCGISELPGDKMVSYSLQNLQVEPLDCAEYDDATDSHYVCRNGYTYIAETKKGDCGSVLILRDNAFDKKIIGIHTAGSIGKGFSVSVYYERLIQMMENSSWESQCAPPVDLIPAVEIETPKGAFLPIGKLPFRVGTAMGSTLRRTAITNSCIESFTKPAHLRPIYLVKDGERVLWDPLMKGLEKCGTVLEPLPQETMDTVSHDVARVYKNSTRNTREKRIFTIQEAVFGIEGDEYFKSLTASTSPGFPWGLVKEPRMAGKRSWMDLDEQTLSESLIHHVEKRIEFALVGRRYPTLWMDLLKDERRPIEKVDQGKTRVFSGSPLDFTVACRMYFGAFVASQAESRIENESLVGTNCYAFDWHLVAKRLKAHGDNIIAGDYSNWDGSVSAQLLFAALDVINEWYGNDLEGNKIRRVLMMDIAFSTHVIGDSVYMWTHSMPSGVYLTATVNTIIGQMLLRLFFLRAVPKHLANMSEFERNVKIEIYGDDNVIGVSKYIKQWFNQQTITEAAASMGMTYTDEQKTGNEVPPTRSLTEVTLLKRHFEFSDSEGRWVGPLQLRTVLDVPNWYRNDNPQEVVLPLIVECTLRELALHPKKVFLENRKKIEDALVEAHMKVPAMPDYDSLRYSMLNGYRTITGGFV